MYLSTPLLDHDNNFCSGLTLLITVLELPIYVVLIISLCSCVLCSDKIPKYGDLSIDPNCYYS